MPTELERESIQTYERFVAMRDKIDAGDESWSSLADFFTEDAVYIDPAWGRIEGREAIRDFFERSMAGLTGYGWSTPEHWTMAEGHRLVSQWDQILGEKPDGSPHAVAGLSILYYVGDGLFCYSHDMLNMTHIGETMRDMGWRPPKEFNMPPRQPNRDISLPVAWAHLEASRAPK
ncbi:MAG: nuclear transport factor 2 family protein [Myxococcota bacterium]